MPVYNRIKCPNCEGWKDIRSKKYHRQVFCKCGQFIAVNSHNSNYCIEYYYKGRRVREKVGPSKSLAENVLHKREVEIAENRFLDVKEEKRVKFVNFAEEYQNLHAKRFRSFHKACRVYVISLLRYFGPKYLDEITVKEVSEFQIKRMKEVSPATVNRELACLKAMFNRAKEWEKFDGNNPACRVRFLKEDNHKVRFLEKEEIIKLINVCEGLLKPMIIVALNTGMRRWELFTLRWRDIDYNQRMIHLLYTKSGKKREIPMSDAVLNALISVRKHPTSPYVFCKPNGEYVRDIRKCFGSALKRAGIENFRFHDLRHTFASQLVMSGIDLNTVRELLGHSDIKTTLIYAHLSSSHKQRAVAQLSRMLDSSLNKIEGVLPLRDEFVGKAHNS